MSDTGRLLVSCPDQPGIVAAVTAFLRDCGANITHSAQYSSDPEGGTFFLRLVFHGADPLELGDAFASEVAAPFGMQFRLTDALAPKRIAVMVSRYDHALLELLWRWHRGHLPRRSSWSSPTGPTSRARWPASGFPITTSR